MNPIHLPTTTDGKVIHLMEECAEVIKVCSKILRFGAHNYHPGKSGDTNRAKLEAELEDLRQAAQRALEGLDSADRDHG